MVQTWQTQAWYCMAVNAQHTITFKYALRYCRKNTQSTTANTVNIQRAMQLVNRLRLSHSPPAGATTSLWLNINILKILSPGIESPWLNG